MNTVNEGTVGFELANSTSVTIILTEFTSSPSTVRCSGALHGERTEDSYTVGSEGNLCVP